MLRVPLTKLYAWTGKTASAGTAIVFPSAPTLGHLGDNLIQRLFYLRYTAGATAHTLTIMRPLSSTRTTAEAASGQKVINVREDPGVWTGKSHVANNAIAANDYICVPLKQSGILWVDVVASVAGTAITMTANLPDAVRAGAPFWFFGVIGDTNPNDNLAHPTYALGAAATTTIGGDEGQYGGSTGNFIGSVHGGALAPFLLHSGNATNAGTFNEVITGGVAG